MPKKIKYVFATLILIILILSVSACSLSPPGIFTPPQPSTPAEPSNPPQHTDPSWTFPSESSSPNLPLPAFPPVIAKVKPSVVSVITERTISGFIGQYTEYGAGSGVIIDDEGYIVTNNHVVEEAKKVEVKLDDGRTFPASIVGSDALTDLAILKIQATDLPFASLGDSSQLVVGDWVVAIGNALGEGISAAEGIVSRLDVSVALSGNTLYGLIQTSAAINPGNSGGPLVNMASEVIGITSAKMAAVGVEGMGYAIGINSAKPVIEDLIHQGHVTRPWLGVLLFTVDSFVAETKNLSITEGALIIEVEADSPAEAAGLRPDDVIIRFGGQEISNVADLVQAIRNSQIGQEIEIVFVRGKDTKTTTARLIESPLTRR